MIEKNGKCYDVTEYKNAWSVTHRTGDFTADYRISKDLCPNYDALVDYILTENVF